VHTKLHGVTCHNDVNPQLSERQILNNFVCCGVRTCDPQNDIRPYILNVEWTMAGLPQRRGSQLLVAQFACTNDNRKRRFKGFSKE